jgi:ankyrin repeat protein
LRDLLNGDICLETGDISGNTALHGCASAGQTDAVRMLLHAGTSVNTRNDNGKGRTRRQATYVYEATGQCVCVRSVDKQLFLSLDWKFIIG